jgi:hypothetical protein
MRALNRSVGAPFIAAICAVMLAATAVAAIGEIEKDPGVCSRNTAGTPSTEFVLDGGDDVWDHVPGLLISPELEGLEGPITVVVFDGPHQSIPYFGGVQEDSDEDVELTPPIFNNILCVVTPKGDAIYYADVDFSGMNLDGLDLDRLEP